MATKHECGEKDDDTKTHLKVQEAVAEDSCLRKLIQGHMDGGSQVSAEALNHVAALGFPQLWV